MSKQTLIPLIAILAGVCIGAFVTSKTAFEVPLVSEAAEVAGKSLTEQLSRDKPSDGDWEHFAQVLESLVQTLDQEISERRILAEQLRELQSEVANLQQNFRVRVQEAFQQQSGTGDGRTNDERLAAAGITWQQLESIQRIEAEAQMQQIALDDRARREGWHNSPRYYEELGKMLTGAPAIRNMLGDDAYDRYLFASGQPNRIAVQSVIPTSPAEKAGFQVGDIVMSYGGESVYSMLQINNLRSSGEKGAPVTVEVIRNGQLMQISIPRGPMGLNGRPTRFDPSGLGNE